MKSFKLLKISINFLRVKNILKIKGINYKAKTIKSTECINKLKL
jgi:hypothetical protein